MISICCASADEHVDACEVKACECRAGQTLAVCRDDDCVLAQRRIGGKANDIVEVLLRFAPGHDFRVRIMSVSAQQYPGFRPVDADASDQSPYMPAQLLT